MSPTQHRPIIEDLKATGYDGIEVPIFEGTPDHYAKLGRMLDEIGLERTSDDGHPQPRQESARRRSGGAEGGRRLSEARCIECTEALGAKLIGGPLHQTLGHFSGNGPTDVEKRARRGTFIVKVGDIAAKKRHCARRSRRSTASRCYFVNTMDDLAAYLDMVDHPAVGRHVRHIPRQYRGEGPGRRLHAQPAAHRTMCTSPRTTAACRGAGMCRGRRPTERSRNPATMAG